MAPLGCAADEVLVWASCTVVRARRDWLRWGVADKMLVWASCTADEWREHGKTIRQMTQSWER
uniref:Uncharacterized protein n=1 Tax=Arundo donax TaxID=35708 RepID=A0A0A8Y7X4_ARUDO